jgi:hypothetical protein
LLSINWTVNSLGIRLFGVVFVIVIIGILLVSVGS